MQQCMGLSFLAKQEIKQEMQEIRSRISSLRSKQQRVGPFRREGIQRSIETFRAILHSKEQELAK